MIEDDKAARAQLSQNILVMIGITSAAEMSNIGRQVMLNGLMQLINYLADAITEVAPIYG